MIAEEDLTQWEEGHLEGWKEGQIEIARTMHHKGLDMNLIAEVTGLCLEELERLLNQ